MSVCYNVSEESKRETRVSDSSGSPLVETTNDFTRRQWQCCMFPSAAKITYCWKVSNNPQTTTTLEDWHDVMKIVKWMEQSMKKVKIKGSTMDSRTIMRDESEDGTQGEKP